MNIFVNPFAAQGGSSELLKNLKADLKQKISELSALESTSEVGTGLLLHFLAGCVA